MNEIDAINELFQPLTLGNKSARDLQDDVAFLKFGGQSVVITTDTLVEGTHFLPSDPIASVARKLVRVNLSDIIAKGCAPIGVFLNISWPQKTTSTDQTQFAAALGDDLRAICGGVPLLGGDTTSIDGPMVASLTMLGKPHGKKPIFRDGAKIGDMVFVTGTIGDALIGLESLRKGSGIARYQEAEAHYQVPNLPPISVSKLIAKFASASLDVSDGLLGDAAKLAQCSNLGIEINLEEIPISNEAEQWLGQGSDKLSALTELATFGDDYQCLFTMSADNFRAIIEKGLFREIQMRLIGKCVDGAGLTLTYEGKEIPTPLKLSFEHNF